MGGDLGHPSLVIAGAVMTAAMMYDAVMGRARPKIRRITAVRIRV